jgi:hypothetical protein
MAPKTAHNAASFKLNSKTSGPNMERRGSSVFISKVAIELFI